MSSIPNSVTVRDVTPEELFDRPTEWTNLAARAIEANPFSDPAVLGPALRSAGDSVRLLLAEADDTLCGVLPIVAKGVGRFRLPSTKVWRHRHAYVGVPLVRRDVATETIDSWLDELAQKTPFVRFDFLPVGGGFHQALARVVEEREGTCGVWDDHVRATVETVESADKFLDDLLSTKAQKKYRRLGRRLAELGTVTFDIDRSESGVSEWLDEFFLLEATGWKGESRTALANDPADERFVRSMARNLATDSRLLRADLRLDGRAVAMELVLLSGARGWAFKIAHDPWFHAYSPGVALDLRLGQTLHDTDISWVDSCTAPGHAMTDRLGNGRVRMQSLWVGTGGPCARVVAAAPVVKRVKEHADGAWQSSKPSRRNEPLLRVDPRRGALSEPFEVAHGLVGHPLFELDRLAQLVDGLPDVSLEFNAANAALVQNPKHIPSTGLSAAETIRTIDTSESWMAIRNVEADPDYRQLLDHCLDEFCSRIGVDCRRTLWREGFIFVSSPGSQTPYHIDPEHNVLLQLRGTKTISIHDPSNRSAVSEEQFERFFSGGHCNLDSPPPMGAEEFRLVPGHGVSVPVAAPHSVLNGPDVSISFSITFRSPWSQQFGRRHRVNHLLRGRGLPTIDLEHLTAGARAADGVLSGASRTLDSARSLTGRSERTRP